MMAYAGPIVWPMVLNGVKYMGITTEGIATLAILIIWHAIILITINGTLYIIYHLEHPFFEKFKTNDKPWPWQEDREKWN
jgi:hypothetical protein